MKRTNSKKIFFPLIILISILILSVGTGLSQPPSEVEKGPEIKLGEITINVREFRSIPSSPKLLEIVAEVFNRDQQSVAPPHSIKLVVTLKEVKFPSKETTGEFPSTPEESTLDFPLPPKTGRVMTVGFIFHDDPPESITFEVQINPPDGDKKTVTWQKS